MSGFLDTSLVVRWLKTLTSNAGGKDLIPGQGTKVSHAAGCCQKNPKNPQNTWIFVPTSEHQGILRSEGSVSLEHPGGMFLAIGHACFVFGCFHCLGSLRQTYVTPSRPLVQPCSSPRGAGVGGW